MKQHTFTLDESDIRIIDQALSQMPYGMVVGLVNKINRQIAEQEIKSEDK